MDSNNLKIALAQCAFTFGEVKGNVSLAIEIISTAAGEGNDIVLLPELWASGYDLKNWRKYATSLDQGVFETLRRSAQKYKIVIGSSLLEFSEDQNIAFNTFVLYGKSGETLGVYRKIHRFRLLEEEKWLGAGDNLVLANTAWGEIGLATCYDLRFPEMFRPYAIHGARLILLVAEWPERRINHWVKLLQARAIENQMFVAGVNKVGESYGVQLGGRSMVVDPWGVPMVDGGQDETLLSVRINLSDADRARKTIPVFNDRRPEIYQKFRINS